jgi:hypothetical protein
MNDIQRKKLTKTIIYDVALLAFYSLIFVGGWVSWTIYVILSALAILGILVTAINREAFQRKASDERAQYSVPWLVWNVLDSIVVVIFILLSPIPTVAGIALALLWTVVSIYVMDAIVSGTRLPRD